MTSRERDELDHWRKIDHMEGGYRPFDGPAYLGEMAETQLNICLYRLTQPAQLYK